MPAGRINKLSVSKENALKKCMLPHVYTIKDQNNSTAQIIVRSPGSERTSVKKDIEKKLSAKKYQYESVRAGGSTGATDIYIDEYKVRVIYKPLSGGMSETTLNSTITELAPALAFMANKTFTDHLKFHKFLLDTIPLGNRYGCYLNQQDLKAGHDFIKDMPTSSKFKEKMENAMAVLKYLKELDNEQHIDQVYFAYRAKPPGINVNHKGDLFVKFKNGKFLGVSLKAGGEKTAEPQLNTYVNKFFDDYGRSSEKDQLKTKVYNSVHKKLGLNFAWAESAYKIKSIDTIEEFREENPQEYEKLYDEMLETCRSAVIKEVNRNMRDTVQYIIKQVLKKDDNVPLVVVKAVGKSYKMVTDEDALENFLPTVKSIKAVKSSSSKQEWFIDLKNNKEQIRMKMSIRTNQPAPKNKIAQGFNLAIKFNGLA